MNTANVITLILAVIGPFLLILGFDLLQEVVRWLNADDENTASGRD